MGKSLSKVKKKKNLQKYFETHDVKITILWGHTSFKADKIEYIRQFCTSSAKKFVSKGTNNKYNNALLQQESSSAYKLLSMDEISGKRC